MANVRVLKKAAIWIAVILLLCLIIFFSITGRLGIALGFLLGLFAFVSRALNIIRAGRFLGGILGGNMFGSRAAPDNKTKYGQASEVTAEYLSMRLDHDSGQMDGEVLRGPHAGKLLGRMRIDELLDFWKEVQKDGDSVQLLEAYLDRSHSQWRASVDSETQSKGMSDLNKTMTEDEALRILGLKPQASIEEIKSTYRRLMSKMHPDHGGSAYLASKVNLAKEFLLKRR